MFFLLYILYVCIYAHGSLWKVNCRCCALMAVVIASVHSERTHMKKMIMIIIISSSSMNKSQELTVFHGRQKLTSAMKWWTSNLMLYYS